MADNQFLQQFDEAMEQRGAIIGGEKVDVLTEDEVDDATTIPATKIDSTSGEAVGWYVAPLSVIMKPIRAAISTLQSLIETVTGQGNRAEQAAGRVDTVIATANTDHTRAEQDHSTATSDHTTAGTDHTTAQSDHTTADTDHTRAGQDHSIATSDHQTADTDHTRAETDHSTAVTDHDRAVTDHTSAVSDHQTASLDHATALDDHEASEKAVEEAENVNAELEGMTVTITDRNGTSVSVNIGFDIYRTYPSVAAMEADAENVPDGKFVMIATTDPTSQENARLYGKNREGGFTFLSDLDQAATSAFADWLENYKPVIEADHSQAQTDHSTATADHSTAAQDHTQASTDHTASVEATANANTQADRAKGWADHAPYIADGTEEYPGDLNYWYLWDEETEEYVKSRYAKGDDLHWSEMTEEEKDALTEKMLENLVFSSQETCEDIIEELN